MNIKHIYLLSFFAFLSSNISSQDLVSDVNSTGNSQRHFLKEIVNENYLIKIDLLDSVFVYKVMGGEAELTHKTHIIGAYTQHDLLIWNKWILSKDIEGSTAYNFVDDISEIIRYEEPYERSFWRVINEKTVVLSQYDDSNAERTAFLIDENFNYDQNLEYSRIYASDQDYLYYRLYENDINQYQKRDKENNEVINSYEVNVEIKQRYSGNYIYHYDEDSRSIIRHDLLLDLTSSIHTFEFEPTHVSMSIFQKQQIVCARNNVESLSQSVVINIADQKIKIFEDKYLDFYDQKSIDDIFIYEHESYDSLVIYNFETGISKTLPFIGSADDIINFGNKYLIYADLDVPFRIINVAYDIENDVTLEIGTDLPFSYRLVPTHISEGDKYYLDIGTDIEELDDLFEINLSNGNTIVSNIIPITRRGLADDSSMKKINDDIFILNQEHLYAIQNEEFIQLDQSAILQNAHQSHRFNKHGIYWAEKSDTIITFYNYREGQKNTIGTIIDNPQIDLYALQIRDFIEGEESIYINGRIGFEYTSFILRKEDNSIIDLESTSGDIFNTSFYSEGFYYYNVSGWIHSIDELGNSINLNIEAPILAINSNILHNDIIYIANNNGIYAIENQQGTLQFEFDGQNSFNYFYKVGNILFLESNNTHYALVNDEWIEISSENFGIRSQIGEHLILVNQSTGTNQIINKIFDLVENEFYDLPSEFNTLNIISTFDYKEELYVITSTRFFPDYEVKIFKTNESFTIADEVLTFETFGRGLNAKFTEFGDEGLLYIGNKIFLMNDELEFIEVEGVYGDTESVSTEENDGIFYFIALHPQKGRQVYNTLVYSKRVSTKDLVSNLISIFPNPTTEFINIDSELIHSNTTIKILDIKGKIILSSKIGDNESVDISQFSEGIYYLNVIDKNGRIQGSGMFFKG